MQYLIIERFHSDKVKQLYQCFDEKGRLLPNGLNYINSWIDEDVSICFQLMESDSEETLQLWVDQWKDLADFEWFPIISSEEAKRRALQF